MSDDAERIVEPYRRHAAAWDAARSRQHGNRTVEADWLDRFLRLLSPGPTVLDIGCGSGEPVGRFLAEHGCILTGVDSAPEMIELCGSRLPGQTWHIADMRSLSLGRVFDGIVAFDSFFHLSPDHQRPRRPHVHKRAEPRRGVGHVRRRAALSFKPEWRGVSLSPCRQWLHHRRTRGRGSELRHAQWPWLAAAARRGATCPYSRS